MNIPYIPEEKVALHLKTGRTLAMFIKTDYFFETATFDWISIEKQDDQYKSTLVRSMNQGDEIFNDILSFETLNQDQPDFDEITNNYFTGTLQECFEWIELTYGVKELKFMLPENLKIIYTDLVKSGFFDKEK